MHHLHEYLQSIQLPPPGGEAPLFACCSSSMAQLPPDIVAEMKRINRHYHAVLAQCKPGEWRRDDQEGGQAKARPGALRVYLYISYGYLESLLSDASKVTDEVSRISKSIPQVDCLVRTSGERRLSNFCMDKLAFAELVFVDDLFPDCASVAWRGCLNEFESRNRRMGK